MRPIAVNPGDKSGLLVPFCKLRWLFDLGRVLHDNRLSG